MKNLEKYSKYIMDLNSRHLIKDDKKLKLTEKEVTIIFYLYESNMPVKIDELQKMFGALIPNLKHIL